jgi:lysyl endopeptidase
MKYFIFTLFGVCLSLSHIAAQVSLVNGTPYSFDNAATLSDIANVPLIEMPFVDTEALLAEDALVSDKSEAYRFGQELAANISPITDGQLDILPDGSRLYRLQIYCKNAISINLVYNHFHIPPGARFYLYNPQQTDVLGAFTDYNNKPHLQFSTSLLRGEVTILEYYEPANAPFPGIINISQVVHGYRGLRTPEKDYGDSGSCNNNVNCPASAGWENEIRSVAMIIEGGFRACSGAIVNNTRQDCTPLFLTANHCLGGSVATWVFMFNYESPICTNQDGPTNQTVSGCTLLAHDDPSDFALVQLSELPPPEYNVYYAGWSAEETAAQNSVCIHHPSGDIKKITFNEDPLVSGTWDATPDTHWEVTEWEDGTTEPGSSGSAMFNAEHRIVGQLHGGNAACGNNEYDTFGKLAYSWDEGTTPNTRLRDWLDPDNTGILVLDGKNCSEPQFSLDASMTLLNIPAALCNQSSINPQLLLRNHGSDALTSATITLTIDGVAQSPMTWTGNLAFLQAEIINLTAIDLAAGAHTIAVSVSAPNSGTDQNAINDQATANISIVIGPELNVLVETDQYPEESSFQITNQQGQIVFAQTDGFAFNTSNFFNVCLAPGCYTFTLLDSYGDGIEQNGGFSLTFNGTVLASDFTFNSQQTSANFCIEGNTQTLNADFSSNETTPCQGESLQFTANYSSPSATYLWTFEGGTPATSTLANPSISYPNAGIYDVSLQVSDNATNLSQTQNDYVNVGIEVNISTTAAPNPISATGSATAAVSFGTAPYSYTWSNGTGSNATQSNFTAGNYSVLVSDANNCTATANFAIESLIAPMQINDFTADRQSICLNESVVLTPNVATMPSNYTWLISNGTQTYSSNETTPSITFTQVGTYTVTCQINDNYTSDELIKPSYINVSDRPQLAATLIQPSFLAFNGSISITASGTEPFSYQWWNVPNSTNSPTIDNLGEGTYNVTVTDMAGCITAYSYNLIYTVNDPSGIVVYPIPAQNMPSIYNSHHDSENLTIELFDVAGRLVGVFELKHGNNNLPVALTTGVYVARIWANETVLKTTKIVIQ